MSTSKPIIYQLLPRLFTNYCKKPVANGTLEQNGSGKLNDINDTILKEIRDLGATHVWYTGIIEHAHDADYTTFDIPRDNPHVIKGHAGSPYAITDYYDIDPDLAVDVPSRMKEFEELVGRTHNAGMKVIIDFVPNHVARQYRSDAKPKGVSDFGELDNSDIFFDPNNNFYYIPRQQFCPEANLGNGDDAYTEFPAKASGNDCFNPYPCINDWYDTVKLNYGVDYGNGSHHFDPIPDTWLKMRDILCYWAKKGVDGFRCDMVHMVPLEFWHWVIPQVKAIRPGIIFIAEIYETGLYRPFIEYGGFDYLYDKVNLYDTLRAIETSNHSAAAITSCWQTVDGIGGNMLNFLENHDEQRFASDFYAGDASRVLPSLIVASCINTGPMMIYFGQELGEKGMDAEGYSGCDGRTTIFDYWSIESVRRWLAEGNCGGRLSRAEQKLRKLYSKVLNLAKNEDAISAGRFFDLMYVNFGNRAFNPHRHYSFIRHTDEEAIIITVNFGESDDEIAVNIPQHALNVMGFPAGNVKAKELLGGKSGVRYFGGEAPFLMKVPAHGAAMWKINKRDIRPLSEKVKA